jgi:hypothetical protein
MPIRPLSRDELAALAQTVDFSRAAKPTMVTANVLPIDGALDDALSGWKHSLEAAPGWDALEWTGVLRTPAAPVQFHDRVAPKHRVDREEPLGMFVQGVEVDGQTLLFLKITTPSLGRSSLWGVDPARERLVFGRSLDVQVVQQIERVYLALEQAALEQSAAAGRPSLGGPRV